MCEPGGACHARPSARVSSTGLETQGPEASLLLLQRNLVLRAAPLRSSPCSFCSYGSFWGVKRHDTGIAKEGRCASCSRLPGGCGTRQTRVLPNRAGPHRLVSLCVFIFFALRDFFLFFGATFYPAGASHFFSVSQTPASEMGTRNSASHLRVCRTNLDG